MRSTFSVPAEFSPAKQLLLEKRLHGALGGPSRQSVISRSATDRGKAPLSFAQRISAGKSAWSLSGNAMSAP